MRPVAYSSDLLVPLQPTESISSAQASRSETEHYSFAEYKPEEKTRVPYLPTQENMNDLVMDLLPSKAKSEVLASCLQEWNVLSPDTSTSLNRNPASDLPGYFTEDGELL